MFANSSAETKTTTEKGFVEGFAKQIGDIGAIMIAILVGGALHDAAGRGQHDGAVGARAHQRAGVLKTLGFSGRRDPALVLAESLFIAFIGGGLGLGLAWLFVQQGDPTGGMLPIFVLPARDVVLGVGLMVAAGPARRRRCRRSAAMRLKITDALRRN